MLQALLLACCISRKGPFVVILWDLSHSGKANLVLSLVGSAVGPLQVCLCCHCYTLPILVIPRDVIWAASAPLLCSAWYHRDIKHGWCP